jgi:hypothetical protein
VESPAEPGVFSRATMARATRPRPRRTIAPTTASESTKTASVHTALAQRAEAYFKAANPKASKGKMAITVASEQRKERRAAAPERFVECVKRTNLLA